MQEALTQLYRSNSLQPQTAPSSVQSRYTTRPEIWLAKPHEKPLQNMDKSIETHDH